MNKQWNGYSTLICHTHKIKYAFTNEQLRAEKEERLVI